MIPEPSPELMELLRIVQNQYGITDCTCGLFQAMQRGDVLGNLSGLLEPSKLA